MANDISTDEPRARPFFACIGATTYNLLKNLVCPQMPRDLSLDELLDALQKHYQPRIGDTRICIGDFDTDLDKQGCVSCVLLSLMSETSTSLN